MNNRVQCFHPHGTIAARHVQIGVATGAIELASKHTTLDKDGEQPITVLFYRGGRAECVSCGAQCPMIVSWNERYLEAETWTYAEKCGKEGGATPGKVGVGEEQQEVVD